MAKKLIAFNYFGGKFTWVDSILPLFPVHTHFVDVFCGSMAITLNKPLSAIDTANDINLEVVNFFRVLREQPDDLLGLLRLTPISRHEYNQSWQPHLGVEGPGFPLPLSDLERARRYYVRVRQSFYGLGAQRKNKGWHLTKTVSYSAGGDTVSKWRNALDKLYPVIDRLTSIQLECQDFRALIPAMDFPGAFFYCDPPYPAECRTSSNDYQYEFTDQDHAELSQLLHSIQGKAMISSYDCALMRKLYPTWRKVIFPSKKNNIRSSVVQECVWMNYPPERGQLSLDYFNGTGGGV